MILRKLIGPTLQRMRKIEPRPSVERILGRDKWVVSGAMRGWGHPPKAWNAWNAERGDVHRNVARY
jgi:hypothetical protein